MNPNDVIDDFVAVLEQSEKTFRDLLGAAPNDALRKQISIDVFLRVAVGFESFRSEWHIAAINQDASKFREAVQTSLRKSAAGAWEYRGAADLVSVDLPRYPSVGAIRSIVDPLGRNVTFGDAAGWKKRSRTELVDRYADRVFALTDVRMRIIDATVSIRNCIAHRSSSALAGMNAALAPLPTGWRRQQNAVSLAGIGAFLYASPPGRSSARTAFFYGSLLSIAQSLRT
jgi:hypothetical protein